MGRDKLLKCLDWHKEKTPRIWLKNNKLCFCWTGSRGGAAALQLGTEREDAVAKGRKGQRNEVDWGDMAACQNRRYHAQNGDDGIGRLDRQRRPCIADFRFGWVMAEKHSWRGGEVLP